MIDFTTNRVARRVGLFHEINAVGQFMAAIGETGTYPVPATEAERMLRMSRRLRQLEDAVDHGMEVDEVLKMVGADIFEWLEAREQTPPAPPTPHLRAVA